MKKQPGFLDSEIERLESELAFEDAGSKKYQKILNQLTQLKEMNEKKFPFSPDAVLAVGANLVTVLLVLHYEQIHVVSTKALNFLQKLKP